MNNIVTVNNNGKSDQNTGESSNDAVQICTAKFARNL